MKQLARYVAYFLPIILIASLTLVAQPASADYWGAYKWTGGSGAYDCLAAGTVIVTGTSPDKHNSSAQNTCATTYQVEIAEYHYDEAGRLIDMCSSSAFVNNYTRCSDQSSTLSGDYWLWYAYIKLAGGSIYYFSCSNKNQSYSYCYNSSD